MDSDLLCGNCGTSLGGRSVEGFCANCLLQLALEPPTELGAGREAEAPGLAALPQGRRIGDYEILEEIARGGMGVVYKARQLSLHRVVALKLMLATDFSSASQVGRFLTEAEAVAHLEHPGIVPIYAIGSHQGVHFFSMRFLEGGTLAKAMARERYTPREAAGLMIKVARAVHHAHQRGILHRDLKPANILFDREREPLVADFGLARFLEHDSLLTQSVTGMGTPSYMAPEQVTGQSRDLTTAADIYSLGAILYELLTGRAPFRGPTLMETIRRVVETEPEPPRRLNPAVDRDLETVCLKCLEKAPQRRYRSADALAEDLDRWLAHRPILARRTSPAERVWKWARRKPVVAGLVVALHLVGLAGIIGILWYSGWANQLARRAMEEAQRATVEAGNARHEYLRAEDELWKANFNEARFRRMAGGPGARVRSSAILQQLIQRPGLTETQILDLREEAIAQLALMDVVMPSKWVTEPSSRPCAWNAKLNHYVHDTGSNRIEVRVFPSEQVVASFAGPPDSVVSQALFSPDGQFLVVRFSKADGAVIAWRLSHPEPVLHSICANVGQEQFLGISPDSRTLALLTPQGVTVQDLSPHSRPRFLQKGRPAAKLVFSPDSRQLAVLFKEAPDTVEIWDAATGAVCYSFRAGFNPWVVVWHPDGLHLLLGGDRGRLEMREIHPGQGNFWVGAPVVLPGHAASIVHAMFTPDGVAAITHAWDHTSTARDVVSGRILLREPAVVLLGISPGGDRLLVRRDSPLSESVMSLMPCTGYRTVAWAGEARSSDGIWISPGGHLGVVNIESTREKIEGQCLLWDFPHGREIARLPGVSAEFSADGHTLFTFERYGENRVRRFDVRPETLAQLPVSWSEGTVVYQGRPEEKINTGTLAPDGRTLVIAATDQLIFLDTRDERPVRRLIMPAHTVELSRDGHWLATRYHNDATVLRSAPDGEAKLVLTESSLVRFSPDSQWMAVVSRETVEIRQLPSLQLVCTAIALAAGSGVTPPLQFSRDGRLFAVAFNRTQVRLHETSTGRVLATLSPPNPAQIIGNHSLAFSPDGQWLLAAKDDGETIAWDIPLIRCELDKLQLDWTDSEPEPPGH